MQLGNFPYQDGATKLEGYVAYPHKKTSKMPAVLVAHAWEGRSQLACEKAEYMASLGYVGFALDMYGAGELGSSPEENTAFMTPFMEDRHLLLRRVLAALAVVKQLEGVDTDRIAAMGFCFGGLCVLDLARSGADIKAVITFHGLLNAPRNSHPEIIKARILALHGHDDPMVPPTEVLNFQTEMTRAKADWQMHILGNTMHAFTNPSAHNSAMGAVYNELAAKRSWQMLENFLSESFSLNDH